MTEHLHNSVLPGKKTSLWTPWGGQKLPKLELPLEAPLPAWKMVGTDDRAVDGADAAHPPV